jgi:prepilin-type N-terminal cleavage/methylation domain-containing protein
LNKIQKSAGFTIIETSVAIAILALLAAFVVTSFAGTDETRDAKMIQSAQASLQTVVAQGAARLDVTPRELRVGSLGAVLLAAQEYIGQQNTRHNGVSLQQAGGEIVLNIESSNRQGTFAIQDNGDVTLQGVSNFSQYEAKNGIIHKL